MRRRLQIVGEPHTRTRSFASIENAIAAIRAGQMVIVVDDESLAKTKVTSLSPLRRLRRKLSISWRSMAAD